MRSRRRAVGCRSRRPLSCLRRLHLPREDVALRYAPHHRAEARERIVAAAARVIRGRGLADASIAAIMGEANLTHGAFYHHFPDRDALLGEAVAAAAAETRDRVLTTAADTGAMLAAYCSPEHAAAPELGCVLAALGTEGAHHQAPPVRAAFAAAARGFLRRVQQVLHRSERAAPARAKRAATAGTSRDIDDEALALASRMVGAVILARLVDDRRLSARILAAARR